MLFIALVTESALLDFNFRTQRNFEKVSLTVSKYLNPELYFEYKSRIIGSACQLSSIANILTDFLGRFFSTIACLCNSSTISFLLIIVLLHLCRLFSKRPKTIFVLRKNKPSSFYHLCGIAYFCIARKWF